MKINKHKLLTALKEDFKASDLMRKEWDGKISEWKSETYGELYGNETEENSKIVSKDIKKQLEWMLPTLADPFLSTPDIIKANPVTAEDVASARQNELLLNTQFCRKFPRYNFIMKALKVLTTEGTVIVQTGWDYEDEEVEMETETVSIDKNGMEFIETVEATTTVVKKNEPTATVCRNEDVFIDPTCMDDMDKCQFVIHRYETDLSTLRADGRYKNLKQVARSIRDDIDDDIDYNDEDDTEFEFKDDPRKKILVHEYWGNYDVDEDGITEAIVCVWVGDIIIRLETNPYPDNKPPFIVVPFNAVPFQLFGEALAESIGDNQKVKTSMLRGIIDNAAKSNNGQVGIRIGALDAINKKRFQKGKDFEFQGTPGDFWQGSYNQLPGSVFDILALQNNEIESQTGVKSFSGGITGSALGGTATGARGALDATATRRMSLVRNIAENLIKPLMRKWMAYNAEFLEEEEVVRVTNEEFVPIRRDDLTGRIDIEIGISTAEDNAAKSQELSFLLQTLGNTMPFEMTQKVIAKIAALSRMPDLEADIKSFAPKPDPIAEQIKQIELENALLQNEKLKADIADKYARAGENEEDRKYKAWKAESEKAKARKLNTESDLKDLTFLKEDNQHQEILDYEKDARDKQHQLKMMVLQRQLGGRDEQIGVPR